MTPGVIAAAPKTVKQYAVAEWAVPRPGGPGNPFDAIAKVTFTHDDSGKTRTTEMFYDGRDAWRFRFCGTRLGRWRFTTASDIKALHGRRGVVTVTPNPGAYGFVTGLGDKWVRPVAGRAEPEAFVPQLVMYGHPQFLSGHPGRLDKDIEVFLRGHGFNGFHVPVCCRWFDLKRADSRKLGGDPNPDPRTFAALERLVRKVHAAGGVVHLWAWGDESRRQTPKRWGINGKADRRLQRYIAARLGPLPGWTMGYGFDLWEWAKGDELAAWHRHMHAHLGWPHMLGARASKNRLNQLTEGLDYSSYEQHRPDLAKYVETLRERPRRPSFSEDRFRIRGSRRYASKDYTAGMTARGMWHSAMAGGVANIWGNLTGRAKAANTGETPSAVYPNAAALRTYAEFFRGRFLVDMRHDKALSGGAALRTADRSRVLAYREGCSKITLDLRKCPRPLRAVAVDCRKRYRELDLGTLAAAERTWAAPYRSDWAIAIGEFPGRGD